MKNLPKYAATKNWKTVSLILCLLLILSAFAVYTIPVIKGSPDNVENNPTATAPVGENPWINPTYAYTSNDVYATATQPTVGHWRNQKWYNYHFDDSIPYGSTIDEVLVKVEGYGDNWANEDWWLCVWNGTHIIDHSLSYPLEDTIIEVDATLDAEWTRELLLDATFYTRMKYKYELGGGGCPETQICPDMTTTLTNYLFAEDTFKRYVQKYGYLTQTNYISNDMIMWIRRKNMYSYMLFIGDLLSDNPNQWHIMDRKMVEYAKGTNVFVAETGLGGKPLYLQNQGFNVFGVTLSSVTAKVANDRGLTNVVNGTVHGQFSILPKEMFDTIIIGDNLLQKRYPTEMQQILFNASSLLKDNGRMIVSGYYPDENVEPIKDYIEKYGINTTIYRHEFNGTHDDWVEVNNLHPDELMTMFESAGLNVIDAILPANPPRKAGYYYIIGEKNAVKSFDWNITPIHGKSSKENTVYLDWIPVNVTYTTHLTQIYVETNDQAGANGDLELTNPSNALYDPDGNLAECSGKWYDENWYFTMFNVTDCSGTIEYVNATFYSIYANVNPNSDTFAIMGNKEDSPPTSGTWNTIWSGTSLWTAPENRTYNITDLCGIDTFDEINQTRFKITSTAKDGGEDTVTWYIDAINITISFAVENYTVTHYFYIGGTLLVNGTNTDNGTSNSYAVNTILKITAVVSPDYTFKNHTYDSSNTTNNPFYLTVTQDYTTHTYFSYTPFREILLLFLPCLFFTMLYEWGNYAEKDFTWSGIVGSIFWIVLSLVWIVMAQTTFIIALFFSGVATFYIVRCTIDLLDLKRSSRSSLGEDDDTSTSL